MPPATETSTNAATLCASPHDHARQSDKSSRRIGDLCMSTQHPMRLTRPQTISRTERQRNPPIRAHSADLIISPSWRGIEVKFLIDSITALSFFVSSFAYTKRLFIQVKDSIRPEDSRRMRMAIPLVFCENHVTFPNRFWPCKVNGN